MKNNLFSYHCIDVDQRHVVSSGVSFAEFYTGITDKPRNLLILAGHPVNCEYNKQLSLAYVTHDQVADFAHSDIYSFGDFCCVDMTDPRDLNHVTETQLAELLYLAHRAQALNGFTFESLHNRFAYWAHDDEWFTKVYTDDLNTYKTVLAHKLLTQLKGRKRAIAPLPQPILDELYALCQQGVVFDYEQQTANSLCLYIVGQQTNMDSLHTRLDRCRARNNSIVLSYHRHTWTLTD